MADQLGMAGAGEGGFGAGGMGSMQGTPETSNIAASGTDTSGGGMPSIADLVSGGKKSTEKGSKKSEAEENSAILDALLNSLVHSLAGGSLITFGGDKK